MEQQTLEQVAADVGGKLLQGSPAAVVNGVVIDSRAAYPGSLFVALAGQHVDGHKFVQDAFANGAVAAFVRADKVAPNELPGGHGLVVVDDTLAALQKLASAQRRRLQAKVAAVTGSVGKTTTKDMLAAIARTRGRVVATRGNYNNEIGLPLTVLDADRNTDVLVLEMGMRGPGEIRELAEIARPHAGVVTNVSPVHLERLGSLENIARAKRELIEQLPEDGIAVLNGDDPLVRRMAEKAPCNVLFFGCGDDNDVRASAVEVFGERGSRFVLHFRGDVVAVELPVPGRHHVMNALAAAAAALALGSSLENVVRGLAAADEQRSAMRTELSTTSSGVRVINDAYNASPASMEAAIELLASMDGRRRIAVLGDMLELGPLTEKAHADIGRLAAQHGVDLLVAVGRQARVVITAAIDAGMSPQSTVMCNDAGQAANLVSTLVRHGDVVLIKASRGVQLEVVAERLAQAGAELREEGGDEGK